jgi:tRNA threonylcarbamoyladenosine biosynthesis protein TsaE
MDSKSTEKLSDLIGRRFTCERPEDTFLLGARIGEVVKGGEMILLSGPLGAGKTLLAKGILSSLEFDEAEVTSPSFTLVNRYEAELTVYHIDLWRIEDPASAASSVGLEELIDEENAVKIVEWAERIEGYPFPEDSISIEISGDGDSPREIDIRSAVG